MICKLCVLLLFGTRSTAEAKPLPNVKVVVGGGWRDPEEAECLRLSGKAKPNVVYIGAASYDSGVSTWTELFAQANSSIVVLNITVDAWMTPLTEMKSALSL